MACCIGWNFLVVYPSKSCEGRFTDFMPYAWKTSRNHGIYLSYIKIRLNWNSVGTLVCCIWMVSCVFMAALGLAEFLVV